MGDNSAVHDISMPGNRGAPMVASNDALVSAPGWSRRGNSSTLNGGGWDVLELETNSPLLHLTRRSYWSSVSDEKVVGSPGSARSTQKINGNLCMESRGHTAISRKRRHKIWKALPCTCSGILLVPRWKTYSSEYPFADRFVFCAGIRQCLLPFLVEEISGCIWS